MKYMRNMKGAVPIRTLALGLLMLVLLIFPLIFMSVSYEISNGEPVNATLMIQYNAIVGNQSNPTGGVFGAYGNLTSQTSTQASSLHNSNNAFSLLNTISLAAQFFSSIPGIIYNILVLIATPITALGINAGFAILIAGTMVTLLMLLAIISAIFLFPT